MLTAYQEQQSAWVPLAVRRPSRPRLLVPASQPHDHVPRSSHSGNSPSSHVVTNPCGISGPDGRDSTSPRAKGRGPCAWSRSKVASPPGDLAPCRPPGRWGVAGSSPGQARAAGPGISREAARSAATRPLPQPLRKLPGRPVDPARRISWQASRSDRASAGPHAVMGRRCIHQQEGQHGARHCEVGSTAIRATASSLSRAARTCSYTSARSPAAPAATCRKSRRSSSTSPRARRDPRPKTSTSSADPPARTGHLVPDRAVTPRHGPSERSPRSGPPDPHLMVGNSVTRTLCCRGGT